MDRTGIGLSLSMSPLAPDLKIRVTLATFQMSEKTPVTNNAVWMRVKGRAINSDESLTNQTGFLSGSLALSFFSSYSALKTYGMSTVLKFKILEFVPLT